MYNEDDTKLKKDGLTLIKGTDENGIKEGKIVVATDFIKANECGYMDSAQIHIGEVEEKLASKGFEGEIVTIIGTMLT